MRRDGKPGRAWTKREGRLPEFETPRLTDLEACREAWEAGNPEALRQGIKLCTAAGGVPSWLADALMTLLKLRPVQRRLWAPYQQDLTELLRFVAVRSARRRSLTWELAYKHASHELALTPAFGSPAAMKRSYRNVSRTAQAAPGRYAFAPPKE